MPVATWSCEPRIAREHRVIGAVGHLVAVEAVLERDGEVRRKLVVVLIEGNPLLEMRAGLMRGWIRAHLLVADQPAVVAVLTLAVGGAPAGRKKAFLVLSVVDK